MMDAAQISAFLPHRYPFLLVDRVLEITAGESIVALKNLSMNEPFFQGHFPGQPVMPGVLLVEAMAQASGILGFYSQGKTVADGSTYYLAGADAVRFKRICTPGDCVMLHSQVLSSKRGIWKFEVRAEVEGELAASATILCADR
ncbi:MAG: 3-hydroxyacyl-ACP dehydratase FabZ [Gammaproteobacteria bacterium]|nr:3-hydroxyacyl-ACP dehydratase FabZ [Gammaproteobacteria bacterium]